MLSYRDMLLHALHVMPIGIIMTYRGNNVVDLNLVVFKIIKIQYNL